MSEVRIQADMQFLAGRLPHRGSNTESEREAAEYIRERFRACSMDTELDDFYSPDNPWYLFASYYAEFTVVSLVAIWWPLLALCYGACVFIAYLAEFLGYRVMARFVPQYETQNVVARFLARRPKRLVVVMAHYDSGKAGPLSSPAMSAWVRRAQLLAPLLMAVVVLTCAVQAINAAPEDWSGAVLAARWSAVTALLCAAVALGYNELVSDYVGGANDNASGVAALLRLGERIKEKPVDDADVYLVATGSSNTWMSGARHFISSHDFDPEASYFLDIDSVGRGNLSYTRAVGLIQLVPCSPELMAKAEEAAECNAVPCMPRKPCADVLIPLIRGYKAMMITAMEDSTPADDEEEETEPPEDSISTTDFNRIARAADFAEAIVRAIARG